MSESSFPPNSHKGHLWCPANCGAQLPESRKRLPSKEMGDVFISYCSSHNEISFWFLIFWMIPMLEASVMTATGALAVAEPEVSPQNY